MRFNTFWALGKRGRSRRVYEEEEEDLQGLGRRRLPAVLNSNFASILSQSSVKLSLLVHLVAS